MTSEPPVSTPATSAIPAASPRGPRRAPSITRVFTAAFLAIAVGVLADRYVTWQNARRTQADMVDLTHHLEQLERLHPSLGLETQLVELRELAADVGDNAIQSALQTTVILAIVLVALAIGLWYNRRRLAAPFGHIVRALERVAAGQYEERVDERQPEELGLIAHSVNQMASALAWRERMQEYIARLLTALNAPPGSTGAGSGGSAGSFGPTLEVLAATTGAAGLALYQPSYDTNEWAATAVRRATAHTLSRDIVRRLVGDAQFLESGAAAHPEAPHEPVSTGQLAVRRPTFGAVEVSQHLQPGRLAFVHHASPLSQPRAHVKHGRVNLFIIRRHRHATASSCSCTPTPRTRQRHP